MTANNAGMRAGGYGHWKTKHIQMKKSIVLATLLFFASLVYAQNELLVQTGDKGLYLPHTVVAKESFYSIGRLFNVAPKDIAAYNGLDLNGGLTVGQELKIPLNTSNFTQSASGGRPVYYTVGPREGLYRVSVKNNNVLLANIRKWNHLSGDNINTGQKLIIGYLISPEADHIAANPSPAAAEPPVTEAPRKDTGVATTDLPARKEDKTEEKRSEEPERRADPPPVRAVSNPSPQTAVSDGSGGYFREQYDQQVRAHYAKVDQTASGGIFKTSSGWQDAKYYALMDGVEPGTIIRVTNPTNNKSIYAKVLGEMSGIRQNQGYDVRISNAAASVLEVTDLEKFIVRVNY